MAHLLSETALNAENVLEPLFCTIWKVASGHVPPPLFPIDTPLLGCAYTEQKNQKYKPTNKRLQIAVIGRKSKY